MTLFPCVWNWSARLSCMSENSLLSVCLKLFCKTALVKILPFQCLKLMCKTARLNILLFRSVWNWSARLHVWKFSSFVFEVDLWHCMSEYSSLSACLKLICKTAHLKILLFRVWSWSARFQTHFMPSLSRVRLLCLSSNAKWMPDDVHTVVKRLIQDSFQSETDVQLCTSKNSPLSVFEIDLWHCMSEYSSLSVCLNWSARLHIWKFSSFNVWSWSARFQTHFMPSLSRVRLLCLSSNAKRMPDDVRAVVKRLIQDHGHKLEEEAEAYLQSLERNRRWQMEAWSWPWPCGS